MLRYIVLLLVFVPFLGQTQQFVVQERAPDYQDYWNWNFETWADAKQKQFSFYAPTARHTLEVDSAQLQENPELLRALMVKAVHEQQLLAMRKLLPLYERLPEADLLLIAYAQGLIALQDGRFSSAEEAFMKILKAHPDSEVALFYLAMLKFQRHDFYQSERYLNALSEYELPLEIENWRAERKSQLKEMKKAQWNFSFNFFYDQNVNQAPVEKYWHHFEFESPKKDGGIFYHASYQQSFFLPYGFQIKPTAHLFGKYYRREKDYNDANVYGALQFLQSNGQVQWVIEPFFLRRYFGNRRYSYHAGLDTQIQRAFSEQWTMGAGARYEKSWHDGRSFFNHRRRSLRFSLHYAPIVQQQFFIQPQVSVQDQSRDLDDQFTEWQIKGAWQGIWNEQLKTTITLQYSQRNYRAGNLLTGNENRVDKIYHAQLALQHRAVAWKGWTPTLHFNHSRHRSNSPLHRYLKNELFLSFSKSF